MGTSPPRNHGQREQGPDLPRVARQPPIHSAVGRVPHPAMSLIPPWCCPGFEPDLGWKSRERSGYSTSRRSSLPHHASRRTPYGHAHLSDVHARSGAGPPCWWPHCLTRRSYCADRCDAFGDTGEHVRVRRSAGLDHQGISDGPHLWEARGPDGRQYRAWWCDRGRLPDRHDRRVGGTTNPPARLNP